MRIVRGWTMILLLTLLGGGNLAAQQATAPAKAVTDSIDQLNDYAWSIAAKVPDSALYYAEEAIRRSRAADNYPRGLINANTLLGILNKDRGYYEISVEHYLEAMQLAEVEGDCLRVSGALNNLGVVAQKQENYGKALEYFRRSLQIEQDHGVDKAQLSIRLYNIGEAHELQDSLDEAYAYFYNSLLIEEELGSKEGIFYARLGIGKVDTRNGNYAKAATELDQALRFAEELGNNPGIAETQLGLGDLALRRQEYASARAAYSKTLEIARKFAYKNLEMEALHGLYRTSRAAGEMETALERLEAYYVLREELNSVEVNGKIGELQTRYEVKKKEQEIEILHKEDELREKERKADRKLRNYFALMVVFVVLMILLNIWRNRRMRAQGNGK